MLNLCGATWWQTMELIRIANLHTEKFEEHVNLHYPPSHIAPQKLVNSGQILNAVFFIFFLQVINSQNKYLSFSRIPREILSLKFK